MLCLDDYFMTEVEKTEKDPETGKKVKKKVRVHITKSSRQEKLTLKINCM